jgi:hypothetical protein
MMMPKGLKRVLQNSTAFMTTRNYENTFQDFLVQNVASSSCELGNAHKKERTTVRKER